MYPMAALVAFSRVLIAGCHYPAAVTAGAILALAMAIA